ncbi:hypothetical protein V2J09_023927 [Rumex salicifolius]
MFALLARKKGLREEKRRQFIFEQCEILRESRVQDINPISLVGQSPIRSEKLGFDLNQMSEDGEGPLSSSPTSPCPV